MMNFVEQLTAITILIDFLFGVTFGIVGGAVLGSRREDYEKTLLGAAPDAFSAGARVIRDGALNMGNPGANAPGAATPSAVTVQ